MLTRRQVQECIPFLAKRPTVRERGSRPYLEGAQDQVVSRETKGDREDLHLRNCNTRLRRPVPWQITPRTDCVCSHVRSVPDWPARAPAFRLTRMARTPAWHEHPNGTNTRMAGTLEWPDQRPRKGHVAVSRASWLSMRTGGAAILETMQERFHCGHLPVAE